MSKLSYASTKTDSIIVNNRAWRWIWCPNCEALRGFTFDVMQANDHNDHDAADICCADCRFVIATVHDSPRG